MAPALSTLSTVISISFTVGVPPTVPPLIAKRLPTEYPLPGLLPVILYVPTLLSASVPSLTILNVAALPVAEAFDTVI